MSSVRSLSSHTLILEAFIFEFFIVGIFRFLSPPRNRHDSNSEAIKNPQKRMGHCVDQLDIVPTSISGVPYPLPSFPPYLPTSLFGAGCCVSLMGLSYPLDHSEWSLRKNTPGVRISPQVSPFCEESTRVRMASGNTPGNHLSTLTVCPPTHGGPIYIYRNT